MRLLKLRLKNLNSLLGSWEIDFTHPRYLSDRLFIITGPTGSGKTTILDAICLALYGQTPRLSKISQSANEIMSKSANDCFAEVEFQARDGFFRASFSQKRAKSSANPFAAAQHEIALAESGEILESSISTKIAKVEELVGMDFGRFTKSILLAQGHFAAFLEADAKDRGLILESITKTEIYGQISTRAYELAATEKTALDVLIKELESLEILDPQEKETLLNALEDLEKSDLALSQKLKTDRLALDWVRNLSQIQKDKDSLVSAKEALTKETQDFAPLAEKLALALKALELESQYVSLAALRLNQTKDQQSLSQTQEREIHSQAAIETAKINLRAAETTLAAKDAAKTEAQPKLSQARALDQQIRVVLASWTEKNQESQKLLARKGQLERTISQLTDSLQTLKKAKDQTTTALTENARDQTLSESLGALEKDANNLTETLNQASNAKKDLERTVFSLKSIGQNLLLSQKKLAEKQTELALLVKDQEATALTLTKISEPSLAYYRDQETQFLTLINNIKEAETFWRTYLDQTTLLSSLGQKKAALSSEMAQNAEISQALSQSAASLEESLELLEASFVAAEAAASLNEHRLRLTPNQPCPLCGALTHPYAQGTAPSPNTAKKDLTAAKAALKETQKRLDKLGQTLAAQNKEAEHLATDETKTLAERETAAKELAKRLTLLNVGPFDPHNPELGAVLANLHKATEKDRAATQSRLAKADEITLELDRLRKRADLAQTELTKAQNSERE
ncbi:MAG: AAA family ATPase, partial [Deltaproteobacteria bacterium]|nr:AAA family ATPase [Deltaproteobacteria bacterium]